MPLAFEALQDDTVPMLDFDFNTLADNLGMPMLDFNALAGGSVSPLLPFDGPLLPFDVSLNADGSASAAPMLPFDRPSATGAAETRDTEDAGSFLAPLPPCFFTSPPLYGSFTPGPLDASLFDELGAQDSEPAAKAPPDSAPSTPRAAPAVHELLDKAVAEDSEPAAKALLPDSAPSTPRSALASCREAPPTPKLRLDSRAATKAAPPESLKSASNREASPMTPKLQHSLHLSPQAPARRRIGSAPWRPVAELAWSPALDPQLPDLPSFSVTELKGEVTPALLGREESPTRTAKITLPDAPQRRRFGGHCQDEDEVLLPLRTTPALDLFAGVPVLQLFAGPPLPSSPPSTPHHRASAAHGLPPRAPQSRSFRKQSPLDIDDRCEGHPLPARQLLPPLPAFEEQLRWV